MVPNLPSRDRTDRIKKKRESSTDSSDVVIDDSNDTVNIKKKVFTKLTENLKSIESFLNDVQNADSGEMSPKLHESWNNLRTFLESQELPGAMEPGVIDGTYCCWAHNCVGGQSKCTTIRAWYIFAFFYCSGFALFNGRRCATMRSGDCSVVGCPPRFI